MTELPGEDRVAERLAKTALRDFSTPPRRDDPRWDIPTFKFTIPVSDAPLPVFYRYALSLIGCEPHGPAEKVAWWVYFTFRGELCQLAHQKFGLRLYLHSDRSEEDAVATQRQIAKKLKATTRAIEGLILDAAPGILASGNATVLNQHHSLKRAYDYFRQRAEHPDYIEDEHKSGPNWSSFTSGAARMQLNAFHDMVAAITAYLSLLEHDLVLAFPFVDFDPDSDNVTDFIGERWGTKWDRVLGENGDARQHRHRLTTVVETWRNPYAHGGFEKGHGATIWLHTPGIDAAIPVGMSRVRESPHFSLGAPRPSEITDVFTMFDEIDRWIRDLLPDATRWFEAGLEVRFDQAFRDDLNEARQSGQFETFLDYHEHVQDQINNMDF